MLIFSKEGKYVNNMTNLTKESQRFLQNYENNRYTGYTDIRFSRF